MERWRARKVVIVGAGAVGSTFAYALAQSGVADEIVLTDMDHNLAQGQVMDLAHGLPYYPNVQITLGTPQDYQDAHVIVITAGSKQRPGETRLALIQPQCTDHRKYHGRDHCPGLAGRGCSGQ